MTYLKVLLQVRLKTRMVKKSGNPKKGVF